ncbi:MAG TPA: nickel-dependent hydrogenase large subunit [Candidatus Competibacteraceae bacterium]|nr:nickel-dependent hydrogenase large subunit [Candidatus Competibacteraceae bacterium]
MPSPEGHLTLHLYQSAGSQVRVDVVSSRPHLADRLFQNKTPDQAAELAGRVFTLCGRAQRLAAAAACAAARSSPLSPSSHSSLSSLSQKGNTPDWRSWQQAVLVETALEHAWRLLIDWPAQAGLPPDMNQLRELRQAATKGSQALADVLDTVRERILLAGPAPPPYTPQKERNAISPNPALLSKTAFPALAGENGESGFLPPVSLLDPAEASALAWHALEEPAFCTRPIWRGQPVETGALARQQHCPLLANLLAGPECRVHARWLARCIELAELPARLRQEPDDLLLARPLAENHGYAWVETARGALLHAVRLEQGRVAAYRIIAPTDWNFHPAGPFAAGLATLGETSGLAAAAQALALSLDPCVSYQVEVIDA